jgi:hypothetical protein
MLVICPKTSFEEQIALDWPAESIEPLLFALKTVLDRLCARLRAEIRRRSNWRSAFASAWDPIVDAIREHHPQAAVQTDQQANHYLAW